VDLKLEMQSTAREGMGFVTPELRSDLMFLERSFHLISGLLKDIVLSWRMIKGTAGLIPGVNEGWGASVRNFSAQQTQAALNKIFNNHVNINVNGTADPKATARAIKEEFNLFLDSADAQTNNEGY
jgi:hypothetical protein